MELHPATLWEAISDVVPDRPALVQGQTRRTWRQFDERASRLAGAFSAHGVGADAKVGLLLYNCPEFLESYFAALKVRAVPFNVNYRYTGEELAYLLTNADAQALVYHSSLAGAVEQAIATTGPFRLMLEVPDGGTHIERSLPYEDVIARTEPAPRIARDADDVTMIYTGGTTGLPKGVVSKVGPPLAYLLDTVPPLMGHAPVPIAEMPQFTASLDGTDDIMVSLPAPPLMHNTGLGIGALPALATGGTVVLLPTRRFDPSELWDTVETE
ncbi:MAG: AMP-binding protein, partial [Actinobacteria bacterium]|nr:AMP-binding protein [Actinomycetota bacterium]